LLCRIVDMKNKEVINIKTGCKIGCVNDVEVDMCNAKLIAIVVYGKLKFFGLLGRYDDIIIKWEDIKVIGDDTILVKSSPKIKNKCKPNLLERFFKWFK